MSPAFCGTIITTPTPSPRDPCVWCEDMSFGPSGCSIAGSGRSRYVCSSIDCVKELHARTLPRQPDARQPFGFGICACVGRLFAWQKAQVTLIHLM
ncbi:uncharacterized protein PHACADRAFT_202381 [Phanerochaete carnosa HHB-10118-sp]|uniref:Uncharacterized protein n=1 Tax=Phanerochaete carnosa (strain HHB-10118-sp) TaxID=650164 RepID=K5UH60_PHACS|nr:uncharacterized protein PHACADRAFT_202381 [Phanerochaete carnosa HHB-10118-sp]EKM48796.1 hypothetical protein PHACADRAFT_202381 [Phanerochaete carnosa HHB-10118-sp]